MEVKLKKLNEFEWEIPKTKDMKVPGRIFASTKLLESISHDRTLEQLKNMASMPGIYKYSIALPDAHQGYGFCIGGVVALDSKTGGLSPGGVGYDINCGVRLVRTNLTYEEVIPKIKEIIKKIYEFIPAGLGSEGRLGRLTKDEINNVLNLGATWAYERDYATKNDLKHTESNGRLNANALFVSDKAKARGAKQLGSLGAGNHFMEIQKVEKIFDEKTAKAFKLEDNQIVLMIHTGSRGLGHQVCSDYLREMERTFPDLINSLPDRELIYAPAGTDLCNKYFLAMNSAANFAWNNRQLILYWARQAFEKVFPNSELQQVYDICHNIAKKEKHKIEGVTKEVFVHRKGATRAFPAGHKQVPEAYKNYGHPVLLPGSMGTSSYVLVGTKEGLEKTFGSTAHGAGRVLSRHAAKNKVKGEEIQKQLNKKNITLKAHSWRVVAEEAPIAYKDINEVAMVSEKTGIARRVVKLTPIGVIKG